jgi:hypothetical protein
MEPRVQTAAENKQGTEQKYAQVDAF